jgi:hypothetical protein
MYSRLHEVMSVLFKSVVELRAFYLYPEYHVKIVKLTRPLDDYGRTVHLPIVAKHWCEDNLFNDAVSGSA